MSGGLEPASQAASTSPAVAGPAATARKTSDAGGKAAAVHRPLVVAVELDVDRVLESVRQLSAAAPSHRRLVGPGRIIDCCVSTAAALGSARRARHAQVVLVLLSSEP